MDIVFCNKKYIRFIHKEKDIWNTLKCTSDVLYAPNLVYEYRRQLAIRKVSFR